MDWLKGAPRKGSPASPPQRVITVKSLPMASDEPVEQWRARYTAAGLTFIDIKTQSQGAIFQTLRGNDPEVAKRYLREEPVTEALYYIVVETPDGNWGTDVDGLFLEKLRPWQNDISPAECAGSIVSLIDGYGSLSNAAKGFSDNWVAGIECGRCNFEWIDGIRYCNLTLVRCASCGTANTVDSRNYTVTHIQMPDQ